MAGGNMIRIGIVGYGNLAKGVESAIRQNPDMTLAAVFTRRDPSKVQIRTEGHSFFYISVLLYHFFK